LPVKRMCALARVSRAGFYRFPSRAPGADRDLELRDALQRIALEFPSYGRPRMTAELRRRGWTVNPKRVSLAKIPAGTKTATGLHLLVAYRIG